EEKVNFSEASNACNQLNLQLASKDQVENALNHGFETCSFGWVKDGFVVIPRITSNTRCGQGKTGLVRWNADRFKTFQVYCFNSSAVQINSYEPDPATTTFPSSSASTDLTAHSASDLTENITAVPTVTKSEQFLKNRRFRVICVTETLPTEGPSTEMPEESSVTDSPNFTSHLAFKNDSIVFGGIPTALLVLAIIFFLVSVVLAVCYIKKYKKTFPLLNKNQQKEMVGTTALKETKSNDKTPEQETKNNENKVEESKTKPEATVKCLEAEV
ncbi:LYVE1 protein, partial [Neodrepanis coruscans]|nr:LYVE1 protein [Neodrepanis coruscans]